MIINNRYDYVNEIIFNNKYKKKKKERNIFADKWSLWGELNEDTLANDNIFVCLFNNTTANGNEIGLGGGLSETNRTLTCEGSVAGATGNPPYRTVNGVSNRFLFSNNLLNFSLTETMTNIYKLKLTTPQNGYLFYKYGVIDNKTYVVSFRLNTNKFYCTDPEKTLTPPIDIPTAHEYVYIVTWCDGNIFRVGWSFTKPNKLSDFPNNQVTAYSINASKILAKLPHYISGTHYHYLFGNDSASGSVYYIVTSNKCLIDNNS